MTTSMQYIGACALLGRISGQVQESDRELIKIALEDCADAFPGRFEVIATSNGGWLLEPILEPK